MKLVKLKLLKKLVPLVFYLLLIVFLVLYLRSIDFDKLKTVEINWFYVFISTVLSLMFRYWGAYIWTVLLRGLGADDVRLNRALIYVYAKSWLGRYIPGTAPWILGKIYFASQHGISKNKLAVSSLLEGGLQIIVVMLLSFLLLIFDSRLNVINTGLKLLMAAIIVIGIISLTPGVFNRLVSLAYRIIRRQSLSSAHFATGKTITKGAGLYTIGAIVSGIGFFYMSKAVFPALSYGDALFVIGATSLAGAASMLALFAPSGLGVREGILLVLLNVIMPTEIALVVTVFTRVWGIVVDLLFFGLASLANKTSSSYRS